MNNQQPPNFSILHAAKRFPAWESVYKDWCEKTLNPEQCEYIVSVHVNDADKLPQSLFSLDPTVSALSDGTRGTIPLKILIQQHRDCCVDNWNFAARESRGAILVTSADDLFPPPMWDADISAVMPADKSEFIIATDNGPHSSKTLISHPIMSRALYNRWGYLFYPEYESVYADDDLTEHANLEGVVVNAQHIVFDHRHPLFGRGKMDEVYSKQNRPEAYLVGEKILLKRREDGFGTGQRVSPRTTIVCCLPGETYADVWVCNFLSLFAELQCRYAVACTFGYSSNVYMTRSSIADNLLTSKREFDYILWLDDDNVLRYDQFEMLRKDLDDNPNLDGVVAWCWIQPDNYGIEPCVSCGRVYEDIKTSPFTYQEMMKAPDDLIEIGYSGFPVVLLRGLEPFRKAGRHPFAAIRDDRLSWGMAGEDASFFIKARAGGCKFAVDRRVKVPHFKRRAAEPNMAQYEGFTIVEKNDGSEPIKVDAVANDGKPVPTPAPEEQPVT